MPIHCFDFEGLNNCCKLLIEGQTFTISRTIHNNDYCFRYHSAGGIQSISKMLLLRLYPIELFFGGGEQVSQKNMRIKGVCYLWKEK